MRSTAMLTQHASSPEGAARGGRAECTLSSQRMIATLSELVGEGNIRRISVKSVGGETLVEVPLKLGLEPRRPVWTALEALAREADAFTVVLDREVAWPRRRPAAP